MDQSLRFFLCCLLVVLAIGLTPASGCSCLGRPPQQMFCDADYVIKADVLALETTEENGRPVERRFTVQVQRIFKDSAQLIEEEGSTLDITTSGDSGTCGVSLTDGVTYLISGSIYLGTARTGTCDMPTVWEDLPEEQQEAYESGSYVGPCALFPCHCAKLMPLHDFCTSDFVIKGEMLDSEITGGSQHLAVEIHRLFKGSEQLNVEEGSVIDITVPINSCDPGARAFDTTTLLITGFTVEGVAFSSYRCKYVEPWNALPEEMREGYESGFQAECEDLFPRRKFFAL